MHGKGRLLKSMVLVDANVLLRYVLDDHADLSPKARDVMIDNDILILAQVIAEVIYVLKGVYKFSREEIVDALLEIHTMVNVIFEEEDVLVSALKEYRDTNLDFVDVLLYSHQKIKGISVITFDKELSAKLSKL